MEPYDPLAWSEEAGAKVSDGFKQYLADLQEVVATPAGRRVVSHLLARAGTFDPAWNEKNPKMFKSVVLKDFGQELLDDIAMASPDGHDNLQREMRVKRKLLDPLLT